jgi:cyanoexosortase A
MIWRVGALSYGGLSFLFWCAVASLVWDKRDTLNLKSGIFASLFAIAILIPLLIKSIFLMTLSTSSLYIFPLVAGLSITLLASGFRGLHQYRKELLILFILGLTQPLINLINNFDPSFLTAQFASLILWYSGFDIVREGTNIYFAGSPQGVEVYPGCSGVDAIMHLLSLTLLFFLLFPSDLKTKILLPLAAIIIGFIANALRVSLLAVIVALHEKKGFEYWHAGEGSLLFSMISAGLLCGVAFLLVQSILNPEQARTEEDNTEIWP